MSLTFGSLFAGVGGFDMGMEQAGWTCKFQVEWDKHCQNILNRHWPDVPKWGDVSTVSGTEIPPVDCIIFGSPCQDLSVAGKRAGLEGERSGLFHEAVRIIKEMRDVTNGAFPRWAIWENVAGALSSNNGRDFATVINEMAEAGAVLQEFAVLDAQHFGVPQRRRRVFVIAIFDPATAFNCPDPLLPVSESVRRDSPSRKPKRQAASRTLTEGVGGDGAWWDGGDTAEALTTTSNEQRMPDKNRFQGVVEETVVGALAARDYKGVGSQYIDEGKVIVEPYVKSRRAQSSTDDETWVEGEINPTLNSFDMGDTRATTTIIEPILLDGRRVDDVRVYDPPVQTLQARMGTGGNNVPVIGTLSFDTQFGSNANVFEDTAPTLKASQQSPSVLQYDGYNQRVNETDVSLTIRIGRDSSDFIAQPTEPIAFTTEQTPKYNVDQAHTITKGSPTGGGHPQAVMESTMAVRRLTPLECERLMGWPDDHTRWKADGSEQADTHRYKQCGNGVATPVARWIAQHIAKAEQ